MKYRGFIIRSKIRFNIELCYEWWKNGCNNQVDIIYGTGHNVKDCEQQIDKILEDIK